jgi:diguanylate cyclase (GGDEF)-like protein
MLARQDPPPDLILLDIMMPEMDGYEVCRRLKDDPATAGIPVIFVTVRSEETDEARGLALGAVDYIGKPFSTPILLARIRTHLKLRGMQLQMERLAVTDELTGCYNRRYFMRQGGIELSRHIRHCRPMALLMLDIDYFKRVNDTCGHAMGDQLLKKVAKTITEDLRKSDIFARIGGEEFAVLLPDTDTEEARHIAERLRVHLHLPVDEGLWSVSVSIGVAAPREGDSDLDQILRRTDKALYRAKAEGRDRVVLAEQSDDNEQLL